MKTRSITFWGVYSVWHRHATVYLKTWLLNFLLPISEPIIYLVAFGYGLTPLVGEVTYDGETISYLKFIAPGMMAIGVLFQSFSEGAYSSFIRLSFQHTWQSLLTAPLSFTEVFIGEWLWTATKGIIGGLLTGMVAVVLGLYSGWHLLISLPVIALGSLLFGAGGLLTAGSVHTIDQINIPVYVMLIPMFTLCGTYFPREILPPTLDKFVTFLPLSPLIDLLRWPLGISPFWWLMLIGMLLWTGVLITLAWKQIYPQLLQ